MKGRCFNPAFDRAGLQGRIQTHPRPSRRRGVSKRTLDQALRRGASKRTLDKAPVGAGFKPALRPPARTTFVAPAHRSRFCSGRLAFRRAIPGCRGASKRTLDKAPVGAGFKPALRPRRERASSHPHAGAGFVAAALPSGGRFFLASSKRDISSPAAQSRAVIRAHSRQS
jgi:hypothetical protein